MPVRNTFVFSIFSPISLFPRARASALAYMVGAASPLAAGLGFVVRFHPRPPCPARPVRNYADMLKGKITYGNLESIGR